MLTPTTMISISWLISTLLLLFISGGSQKNFFKQLKLPRVPPIIFFLLVFSGTLFIQYLIYLIQGEPVPKTSDEFCYLLSGETYSKGRFANPAPSIPKPFQSPGYIVDSQFYSKFQPAQGLSLALGFLLGKPIYGVWIVISMAVTTSFWALRGLFSRQTALYGILLMSTHPLILFWSQNYWGGGVPLLGGALLWGGWMHYFFRRNYPFSASVSGVGLLLLLFSRPFEGFFCILLIAVGSIFFPFFFPSKSSPARSFSYLSILSLFALLGLLLQILFNLKTTQSPFLPPYLKHENLYMIFDGPFIWSKIRASTHEFPNLLTQFSYQVFDAQFSCSGFSNLVSRFLLIFSIFITGFYPPPLFIMSCFLFKKTISSKTLFLGLPIGGGLILSFMIRWYWLHYSAPYFILIAAFYCIALLHFERWKRKHAPCQNHLIPFAILLMITHNVGYFLCLPSFSPSDQWAHDRVQMIKTLESSNHDYLILVRYSPEILKRTELPVNWVQNRADLLHEKVLWAFDNTTEESESLIRCYPHRKALLLNTFYPNEYTLSPWTPRNSP